MRILFIGQNIYNHEPILYWRKSRILKATKTQVTYSGREVINTSTPCEEL